MDLVSDLQVWPVGQVCQNILQPLGCVFHVGPLCRELELLLTPYSFLLNFLVDIVKFLLDLSHLPRRRALPGLDHQLGSLLFVFGFLHFQLFHFLLIHLVNELELLLKLRELAFVHRNSV